MALHIQDPTDPHSDYLIDSLLDACQGAQAGGGAFAFLSSGGVKLFLGDHLFSSFIEGGSFDLLVGVDAITDTAAIGALTAVQAQHANVAANVLVPTHAKSIFHPKFAWFDRGNGGVLVTGSGNLTAGGLRWNIEAYTVQELSAQEIAEVREQWDAFKVRSVAALFAPDDPHVVALLEQNAARRRVMREAGVGIPAEAQAEEATITPVVVPGVGVAGGPVPAAAVEPAVTDEVPPIGNDTQVLVAEIPKASNRWGQANFNKDTFVDFYGASMTVQRRAYLFHVHADGTLGTQEVRPAVVVASHNYRFELDAASGLHYPIAGRPIGVFARVATRTFVYMLLMPGAPGHAEMLHLLGTRSPEVVGRMRRIVFNAADVRAAWPVSPLWQQLTV